MSTANTVSGILVSQTLSSVALQKSSSTAAKDNASQNFGDVLERVSAAGGSVTNININNATVGQVLVASQALGLGSACGYLETMSSDTDGSSATANVLKNSTTYNIPNLFESWANFDEAHGAEHGAQQLRSIEKALVARADANGNISVDTTTYETIAAEDAL